MRKLILDSLHTVFGGVVVGVKVWNNLRVLLSNFQFIFLLVEHMKRTTTKKKHRKIERNLRTLSKWTHALQCNSKKYVRQHTYQLRTSLPFAPWMPTFLKRTTLNRWMTNYKISIEKPSKEKSRKRKIKKNCFFETFQKLKIENENCWSMDVVN